MYSHIDNVRGLPGKYLSCIINLTCFCQMCFYFLFSLFFSLFSCLYLKQYLEQVLRGGGGEEWSLPPEFIGQILILRG